MRAVNKRNVTVVALIVILAVLVIAHEFRAEPESVPVVQQSAKLESGAGAGLLAPPSLCRETTALFMT